MAVFSSYFDASGNKRMKAMTFAGFVSRVSKWDRFNKQWAKILSEEGVTAFHMTDFASSKGEYMSWKGDTERRRRFIAKLVDCIKRNTNKGFSSGVYLDDYNEVNRDFQLAEKMGQPYTLCGFACLGALAKWALKKKVKADRLLIFIEQGDEGQNELIRVARRDGFKVVPLFKEDAAAFQAGDLTGWKNRTVLQESLKMQLGTKEEADRILRSLEPLEGVVQRNAGWDKDSLYTLCNKKNIPKRV
jgi:hypothetical protein